MTRIRLPVRAQTPNIDNDRCQRLAKEADKDCPVSDLLRYGLNVDLKADLI
jgi:organic hydroperoxide reductase OsmC/OhrA